MEFPWSSNKYGLQARAHRALLLFAAVFLLPACFPSNRLDSSSSSIAGTLPVSTTPSDGARGQCLNIDKSRPERNICIDCYSQILTQRCPGKSDPSECLDQAVKTSFTNLVNQCILQTLNSGSSCAKTCTSGLVLDRASCTCVLPAAGGNIPPIDSGQINYGPPVVELDWPLTFSAITNTRTSCEARIEPVGFLVQNRGDTVPQFNQYSVESYSCSNIGTTGYLQNVLTPSLSQGHVEGKFGIKTAAELELLAQNTIASIASVVAYEIARTATYSPAGISLPEGTYLLNFDLKIADDWKGAGIADSTDGPHSFKVTRTSNGVSVLLNNTFSSLPMYAQSFTGPALSRGSNTVEGPGADAVFRIAVPVTHDCVGVPPCDLTLEFTAAHGSYLDDTQKWALENIFLRPMGMEDFESVPINPPWGTPTWQSDPGTATPADSAERIRVGIPELSQYHGKFAGTDQSAFTMNNMPSGKYLVSFDFYVLDTWTGEGAGLYSPYPLLTSQLTNAESISAGGSHSCAIITGGGARCWGENQYSQLGNNATVDTDIPVSPQFPAAGGDLAGVTAIDAGGNHTCAIVGGVVRCWGYNIYGQLGDASTTTRANAVTLSNAPAGIPSQISAGENHTCAIFGTNAACWGRNSSGQIGDNTKDHRTEPTVVLNNSTQVEAGGLHTCALRVDKTVSCWGAGTYGQLGDNQYIDHLTPFQVPAFPNVDEIAVGGAHSCARIGTQVYCWGDNSVGQLGTGTGTGTTSTPTLVSGLGAAVSITAGETHTCARLSTNEVKCWGSNASGKLGDGTITDRNTPVNAMGLAISNTVTVQGVSAGNSHTCARLSDKKVQCWGANASDQLGRKSGKNKFQIVYGAGAGTTVFDQSFSNTDYTQSYRSGATVLKRHLAFLDIPDSIYRLNVVTYHSCPTTAPCDFKLTFKGDGLDDTRSWAMDNFGVMPLPECGIQYTFTDTNQLTSKYCLRFNPFTSCGQTSSNTADTLSCSCWALPATGGLVPHFAPISPGESCP